MIIVNPFAVRAERSCSKTPSLSRKEINIWFVFAAAASNKTELLTLTLAVAFCRLGAQTLASGFLSAAHRQHVNPAWTQRVNLCDLCHGWSPACLPLLLLLVFLTPQRGQTSSAVCPWWACRASSPPAERGPPHRAACRTGRKTRCSPQPQTTCCCIGCSSPAGGRGRGRGRRESVFSQDQQIFAGFVSEGELTSLSCFRISEPMPIPAAGPQKKSDQVGAEHSTKVQLLPNIVKYDDEVFHRMFSPLCCSIT